MDREFELINIDLLSTTQCYDTKWNITVRCIIEPKRIRTRIREGSFLTKKGEFYKIQITRFDSETEDEIKELINKCKTVQDIFDEHIVIYYD